MLTALAFWERPMPKGMSIWQCMPVLMSSVTANPHAAYLFIEQGPGYKGTRLHLTRTHEETDSERIEAVRRESRKGRDYGDARKFLVHFKVEKIRPLVGD